MMMRRIDEFEFRSMSFAHNAYVVQNVWLMKEYSDEPDGDIVSSWSFYKNSLKQLIYYLERKAIWGQRLVRATFIASHTWELHSVVCHLISTQLKRRRSTDVTEINFMDKCSFALCSNIKPIKDINDLRHRPLRIKIKR